MKPKAATAIETTRKPAPSSSNLPMPSLSNLSIKPTPVATTKQQQQQQQPQQDSWSEAADDWSSTKFTPVQPPPKDADKTSRMDEAKRKREERKQQRLQEIEAKRAAKGPMKLGGQKDKMLWDELE